MGPYAYDWGKGKLANGQNIDYRAVLSGAVLFA